MREVAGLDYKKKVISGFLQNHKLKSSDAGKILKFLMKHDTILKRVFLVNNIHSFDNVILISSKESPAPPFLCRLKGQTWDNVDEVVAIMILSPPQEIFLCLAGEGEPRLAWETPEWAKKPSRSKVRSMVRELEKEILKNFFVREKRRLELEELINQSLDAGDLDRFTRYSQEYRKVVDFK